jgi:hypothetical protein
VVSPRLLILAARMSPMLGKKYEIYKSSLQSCQHISLLMVALSMAQLTCNSESCRTLS